MGRKEARLKEVSFSNFPYYSLMNSFVKFVYLITNQTLKESRRYVLALMMNNLLLKSKKTDTWFMQMIKKNPQTKI